MSAASAQLIDPYSFTSTKPWINHEWLSEILMYGAYAAAGSAGLIALKLALLCAMVSAIIVALRTANVPEPAQELLAAVAVVGTFAQQNHVRPQLFSLALFAWLLVVLVRSRRRPLAQAWAIPILAIWANLHGGWIVGAGTLVIWTGSGLVTNRLSARDKRRSVALAIAAVAVTVVNPYGPQLWAFLHETVGFGRADITEWQPVFAAGGAYAVLWAIIAATALAGLIVARNSSGSGQAITVVLIFAVASFRVNRLQAFFAISTIILLGPFIAATMARRGTQSPRTQSLSAHLAIATAGVVAAVIIAAAAVASARNISCIHVESDRFPEPDVASFMTRHGLRGRLLTWFDWGEYAIWHLSPSMVVSIDGRRETVYSDETIRQHLDFYYVPSERRHILSALQPDFVWVPVNLDLAPQLMSDGWTPLFHGDRSVLLGRQSISGVVPAATETVDRCFPGP